MPCRIRIKAVSGDLVGNTIVCEDGETILFGRAKECKKGALPRDDESTSRRHFAVEVDGSCVRVWDLGSTHGTLINGKQYGGEGTGSEKVEVHDGDRIQAGEQVFVVTIEKRPQPSHENAHVPLLDKWSAAAKKAASMDASGVPEDISQQEEEGSHLEQEHRAAGGGAGRSDPEVLARPAAVSPPAAHVGGKPPAENRRRAACLGGLNLKSRDGPPVIEGYQVQRKLGRGVGTCFLCTNETDGTSCVIKVVRSEHRAHQSMLDLVHTAVETLVALEHANIVRMRDYGITDFGGVGVAFCFAMEYCPTGSVQDLLEQKGGRLPPHDAYDIILGSLAGLAHAHNQGVIHGNIKPSNMLLVERESKITAKIGDFALDRILHQAGLSSAMSAGYSLEASPFAAPEQVKNPYLFEMTADVWSAGAVFYNMLTGQWPRNSSQGDCAYNIMPVRKQFKAIPKGLDRIFDLVDRSLASSPLKRFKDGVQMYQCLRSIARPAAVIVR